MAEYHPGWATPPPTVAIPWVYRPKCLLRSRFARTGLPIPGLIDTQCWQCKTAGQVCLRCSQGEGIRGGGPITDRAGVRPGLEGNDQPGPSPWAILARGDRPQFIRGAYPGPLRQLARQVERFDDGFGLVLAPSTPRQHQLNLELVAIGVGAVHAERGAMGRLVSASQQTASDAMSFFCDPGQPAGGDVPRAASAPRAMSLPRSRPTMVDAVSMAPINPPATPGVATSTPVR